MTSIRRVLWPLLLLSLALAPGATQAQSGTSQIPTVLEDWVPWVLRDHPELACPVLDKTRLCAWPGRLQLQADVDGGTFVLDVRVDRELDLPLPGAPKCGLETSR